MYDIDWTKIKNDSKGFEDLAREYVKDVFSFPYGEWKETSTTHDGNKDAYTIIIGFTQIFWKMRFGGWRQNILQSECIYPVLNWMQPL